MIFAQKMHFFWPVRASFGLFRPKTAQNWFPDQLTGLVGLGAHAVSRKIHIYSGAS